MFLFTCLWVCVCMSLWLCAFKCRWWRRQRKASGPLGLAFNMVVRHLFWMLGNTLRCSCCWTMPSLRRQSSEPAFTAVAVTRCASPPCVHCDVSSCPVSWDSVFCSPSQMGVHLLPVSSATCPCVLCRGTPCSLVFHRPFQRCLISSNSVNSQLLFSEFYLYFFLLTHLTLQTKAELEDYSFRKADPRHNCSASYASLLVHWPWGFLFLHF